VYSHLFRTGQARVTLAIKRELFYSLARRWLAEAGRFFQPKT
jgi:hypothetical protein